MRTPEEGKSTTELKRKVRRWVEELKGTDGVLLEEDFAYIAPQYKKETGLGYTRWLEAIGTPHLELEYFPETQSYTITAVEVVDTQERYRRLEIQDNKLSYSSGILDRSVKGTWEGKPLPPNILSEFNDLLPDFEPS